MKVSVYTSHEQTEQPQTISDVTAVATSAGILAIETGTDEDSYRHRGFYRFKRGEWSHYEVYA